MPIEVLEAGRAHLFDASVLDVFEQIGVISVTVGIAVFASRGAGTVFIRQGVLLAPKPRTLNDISRFGVLQLRMEPPVPEYWLLSGESDLPEHDHFIATGQAVRTANLLEYGVAYMDLKLGEPQLYSHLGQPLEFGPKLCNAAVHDQIRT